MKEPKIRFKGFKGEWEKKKLGAMTSVRGGYAFQSSLFQKYGIPVVRISNILSNGNVGGDFVYYPRLDGDTNITIQEKDVVIAMSGATTGKIARVDVVDGILYQNQRVGLFTKTGKVDYDFLYTVLNRPHFNELLNKLLTSSAQPNASSADIESIEMEFPEDAEEQKALSNYILSLDSLIQSTTKKIESLKQVKAASLQSMFPQEGETTPRVRFKGFEGEWEKVAVSTLLEERREFEIMSDEYPLKAFIAYVGVSEKGERYDRSSLVNDVENKVYKKTDLGDFIYSSNNLETGSIGLNKYGKATISPVYSIFKCTEKSYSGYIGCAFTCKDFINKMVKWRQGVMYGQWRIHESDFLKIDIFVPSFDEQRCIGNYFTNLDRQINLQSQRLEKLKQIKAACLDNMFV